MEMSGKNLDSLAELMNGVINNDGHASKIRITSSQYVSYYLRIFLEEVKRNNGEPIPYDAFGDRLWIKLNVNIDSFQKEADEFMNAWNEWVYLYRYLKLENELK